jgi:ubiquinone/menaquinone biosynthesis C-methylase UbiE
MLKRPTSRLRRAVAGRIRAVVVIALAAAWCVGSNGRWATPNAAGGDQPPSRAEAREAAAGSHTCVSSDQAAGLPGDARTRTADESKNRDPHGPDDVEAHIRWLESSERDWFQKPAELITALRLPPDAVVADLGCGPGYLTRPLARAVPEGIVYAVDVEPRQLYRLQEYLRQDEIHNVVPTLASLSDPYLPPGRIDLILVVDTYHHFEDRERYLQTLARALKPSGRLAIVDYHKRELPVGPPVDHKMARDDVLREVLQAGYALLEEPEVLPYQYFLVFGRPGARGGHVPADGPTPPAEAPAR